MANNVLKPCPFCGGKAKITKASTGYDQGSFTVSYKIGCPTCNFYFGDTSYFVVNDGIPSILADGYRECVNKWNRRTNDGT